MTQPKEAQEGIQRLQLLEQNLQAIGMQKQQFQAQLFEIEGAIKEMENSPQVYKLMGGILMAQEKPVLKKELESKKEMLELRVQTLEKQEKQVREKSKKLQEEVLAGMKE